MAALTQKALQSAPKTAAQMARVIAANAKNEIARVAETTQAQVFSAEKQPETRDQKVEDAPSVVSEIKNQGVETVNREQLATWEQSRIKQLEDMIAQVRRQDQQKLKEHNEVVQQEMQATESVPTESVGVVGKVRHKVGQAMGKVKQKVQNLLSSKKSSESKSGSGKG